MCVNITSRYLYFLQNCSIYWPGTVTGGSFDMCGCCGDVCRSVLCVQPLTKRWENEEGMARI